MRSREVRSAHKPSGIDSSRNGRVCAVASTPTSPGPAPSISTATMGVAARLSCSADCAARFDQARPVKDDGSLEDMEGCGASGPGVGMADHALSAHCRWPFSDLCPA